MSEGAWITKRGRRMSTTVRVSIINTLIDPAYDALSQAKLARIAGVSVRTLRDYLTPAFLEEISRLRGKRVAAEDLHAVDRAMLEKARAGNVGAARLIYERVASASSPPDEELPSLDEIEAMVADLKGVLRGKQ